MRKLFRSSVPRWIPGLLAVTVGLSPACYAQRQFQVGVGTHVGDGAYPLPPTLAAVDALGVSVRDDVRWSGIETSPGKLEYKSSPNNMETLLNDVLKRGQRPVIVLPSGNKLYDGGGQITSTEGIAAFARYAGFVASKVAGSPKQIEVWNEWDHGSGATAAQAATKGDPVAYANLLRGAYNAIKAQNRNNVVIGGALASVDTAWVEKFAQAGGLKYLDAFSVHPYVHCNGPHAPLAPSNLKLSGFIGSHARGDIVRVASSAGVVTPMGGTPEQSIALLDTLKALLDQNAPGRDIPVYVTEMGWPTSAGQCGVEDSVAAAYLQRFMLLAAARPYIAGVWWYDLFDDGADSSNREYRFGLSQHNYQPKPAYTALLALKDILNSNKTPVATVGAEGEIVVSGQLSSGKSFYAAWLPTNNFSAAAAWSQGSKLASSGFRQPAAAAAASSASSSLNAVPTVLIQQ